MFKKLILLLAFQVYSQPLISDELIEIDEDQKFDRFTEERQLNYLRLHLKELLDLEFTEDYQEYLLEQLYQSIKNSGTRDLHLSRGTRVFDLKKKKFVKTSKDRIVKAYKKADQHGFFYLINKFGQVAYKTQMRPPDQLDQLVEMHDLPDTFRTYEKVFNEKNKFEKVPKYITHSLQLGAVMSDASYLKDIYDDNSLGFTSGASALYDFQIKLDAPIQFGMQTIANYQLGSGDNRYQYMGARIGPSVKLRPFKMFDHLWKTNFSAGVGLAQTEGSFNDSTVRHRLNYIRCGLEQTTTPNSWSWGVALDWANHDIAKTQTPVLIESASRSMLSLNIFLYKDWSKSL